MYAIIGLGNPGPKYDGTRHNIGFETIDYIAEQNGIWMSKLGFKALYGEGYVGGEKVILVKPQTFMNLSGETVRVLREYYKLELNQLIVIHDDISMEIGKIRIREKGSAGGHNGLKSIIYQLQSDVFTRIKIGVGSPENPAYDIADYVLGHFTKEEIRILEQDIIRIEAVIPVLMREGVSAAMNALNQSKDKG